MTRRRAWWLAVVLVVGAVAAGVSPSGDVSAAPTAQRLYVITDSVGLGAAPAIRSVFAGWQVTIDADPGEFTETLERKYVAPRLTQTPDVFGDHAIVATGYNYPFWDPARFDRSVDSMIATLERAGVRHVHWVTLREVREQDVSPAAWRQASGYRWYLATVNEHLERALDRHPNLTLIDWAAIANQPGITYDAIHLNTAGAALYAVLAKRIVDGSSTTVADGSVTRIEVPGATGIAAVSVNVTVTDTRDDGYLTAYPCDAKRPPTASFHNSTRDDVVAHSTIVPLDDEGAFCVATRVATNLVVDITGQFPEGRGYHPIGPVRWVDTREAGDPVRSAGRLRLDLADVQDALGGLAVADVAAVALSVTATDTAGPGYLTVAAACAPTGEEASTSNVNYLGGDTVPNLVIVEPDAAGRLCISALTQTHVVVDLLGAFDASAGVEASRPQRAFDSRRTYDGLLPFDTPGSVALADVGAPAGTTGLVVNLTAVGTEFASYATAYPCGGGGRFVSQLNMPDGAAVSNAVLVAPGPTGEVCAEATSATNLIVDVMGTLGQAFEGVAPERLLDTRYPAG